MIPHALKQAAYATRRKAWTDTVLAQIATFHAAEAEKLRAAGIDVTDSDAIAAHMKAMDEDAPE